MCLIINLFYLYTQIHKKRTDLGTISEDVYKIAASEDIRLFPRATM